MRGGGHLKREWITILVLIVIIVVLFPATILRWKSEQAPTDDIQIRVKMPDGQIEKLPLEEYLIGVVAAEMPAEFELEALKAQAVAARTYAAKRLSQQITPDPGFDVDTTVNTQAWISQNQMREKWGWVKYWRYHGRIEKAVNDTQGQVVIAEGQYIDAFYFSSAGRKSTERAEDVWSSSRTYLQNVSSGEQEPNRFVKTYSFTPSTLYKKLGVSSAVKAFTASDFVILSKTATGRVKSVRVLGKDYTGAQLRSWLGLASTDMEVSVKAEEIQIKTYGNGHAVGMSQYGANDLAKSGQGFADILKHFYPGTTLVGLK